VIRMLRVMTAGAIGVVLLASAAVAGAASMSDMGPNSAMPSMDLSASPPLAGGIDDGSTTMAVVPMGHLSDPFNTFYQTFTSVNGAWSETTPPGVGTNGGIVVASPTNGAVAVLPFYASSVSALSLLANGVSVGTGEVVGKMSTNPSALSVDPASGVLAFVGANGQVRVQSKFDAPFKTATTLSALQQAPTLKSCGVQAITSVAVEPGGSLALGLRCSKGGTSAVAQQNGSSWAIDSVAGLASDAVVRLDVDGQGLLALVKTGGMHATLRALQIEGSTVVASPAISIMNCTLRATSVSALLGATRSDIVTMAGTSHAEAVVLTPGAKTAHVAPLLPLSTQSVVSTSGSDVAAGLTAISVNKGIATIKTLTSGGAWTTKKVIRVSIQYGSAQ
jgi:hypothetical protein